MLRLLPTRAVAVCLAIFGMAMPVGLFAQGPPQGAMSQTAAPKPAANTVATHHNAKRSKKQAPEPEIFVRSEHDGTIAHVKNFLDCMRTRKAPNASIQVGFEAARTSWIGNIAFKRGMKTSWNAAQNRLVS